MTTFHEYGRKDHRLGQGGAPDIPAALYAVPGTSYDWQYRTARGQLVLGCCLPVLMVSRPSSGCASCMNAAWTISPAGLIDPPREAVPDVAAQCKTAGIVPVGSLPGAIIRSFSQNRSLHSRWRSSASPSDPLLTVVRNRGTRTKRAFCQTRVMVAVAARASLEPNRRPQLIVALQTVDHYVAMNWRRCERRPNARNANIGIAMGITKTDGPKKRRSYDPARR